MDKLPNRPFQNQFVLTLLFLFLLNFFGITEIGGTVFLGVITCLLLFKSSFKGVFTIYVLLIVIGIFASAISSQVYRSQNITESLRSSAPLLCIVIYFFFQKIDLSSAKIEKLLYGLIVIFIVCYLIQLVVYPKIIFVAARVVDNQAAGRRIALLGQGLASLGTLYGVNKYLLNKKATYLIIAVVCLYINFNNGYRTMVFVSILFSGILLIRIYGFSLKLMVYAVLFVIFGGILALTPPVNAILENMQKRNSDQNFGNADYIRTINLVYHETEYFSSNVERFFGSGMPFKGSQYSQSVEELEVLGYWYQDWGLIGLSWLVGIFTVLCMVFMSIKAVLLKVNSNYYYAGMWMVSLIASSITTHEFYSTGNFLIFPLLFALIEKENIKAIKR
ncbi:hypothetical protein ACUN24_02735 [Pedobacter sp. WC2501]|uniref:hypothetical protein n=1 Tax=Pedobacter sp. WC2501 TaxID=3461400 RepID=UPI0040456A23